jgi:two-component system, response regulator PdtaR
MALALPFKVLVVEDEALIRLDLASYLMQRGFDVLEAGSAAEAIEYLESDRTIRVVFTDIRMPGDMDGIALAKCVRERWPPTIIVICSGNSEEAVDVADIHIIEKPYMMDKMVMVLNAVEQQLQAA